ncbi:MAG: NBR1-Ig-like domain-containing protein [Patescibacteria group bacterium]
MANTGNSAWSSTAPAYLLGSSDPQGNTRWGLSSTPLDVTPVGAGQNTTFNFSITSPSTPGTYSSRWKMFQNTITWFGAECGPVAVTVSNPVSSPTPIPTLAPCSVITSPAAMTRVVGGPTGQVTAILLSGQNGASITNMAFGSYNTSIATVSPANDSSSIYATNVTGVSAGSTAVWATATLSDGRTCPASGTNDTNVTVVTPTPAPGCNVSLTPATASINQGASTTLTATVSGVVGTVDRIAFVSGNTSIVDVSPDSDLTSTYTTSVTGMSGGVTSVTATCYLTGSTSTARGSDSTTVTVVAPTLAPTVAPKVWTVTTAPVCSTGGPVTTPLRMFRYLGPTTAPVYTQDSLAAGNHTMAITSTGSIDVVWVGMKDASGNSFQPTSITPADPDVSFGQDFSPAVWTAQWNRANLPAGSYTVNVNVVPVAPSAPTADSNSLNTNQVTLVWSPPLDWGFACVSNNTYKVFMSPESAGYSGYPDNCTAVSCTGAPLTTTASTSTTQTITLGQRYCWAVVANNGSMDSVPSNFRCFDTSAISSPWWQAVTGDAVAAAGQANSKLPGGEYLVEILASGKPGMVFADSLGTDLNAANNISVSDWWSDLTGYNWSAVLAKPENTYEAMRNRVLLLGNPPVSGSPIQLWTGGSAVTVGGQQFYLYRANTPVTVSGLSNNGRKVILIVDGSGTTTLNANITFSASGFGLILAQGNIVLNSAVTALQGIYFAGNTFDTGAAANTLTVDGTVVGMGGVSLQRTGGGAGPSELFNFRPDFTMILNQLGLRRKIVQELVNP